MCVCVYIQVYMKYTIHRKIYIYMNIDLPLRCIQ